MLQQPVSPHVPQLHRVVHAGSSDARATGVEVHAGDKAGETGPPQATGPALHLLRADTTHPAPSHPRIWSHCPQVLLPSLSLQQVAAGEQGEAGNSSAYSDLSWTHQKVSPSTHKEGKQSSDQGPAGCSGLLGSLPDMRARQGHGASRPVSWPALRRGPNSEGRDGGSFRDPEQVSPCADAGPSLSRRQGVVNSHHLLQG